MIQEYTVNDRLIGKKVARVVSKSKNDYIVTISDKEQFVIKKGKIPYFVGDIVEISKIGSTLRINDIIQRERVVSKAVNKTAKSYRFSKEKQILATNVDQIFIFMAIDQNFSLSKMERYVLVFSQKDIEIHLVITKTDLNKEYKSTVKLFKQLYPDIGIIETNIYNKDSVKYFESILSSGSVGIFIGSSGAGKSTMINHILGVDQEAVGEVRKDGKGKHTTTTSRMIYYSKINYNIIDTPGFKGIDKNEDIDLSILYADIEEVALSCRFSDCTHANTLGCAIKKAVEDEILNQEKVERYFYNLKKCNKRM